MTVHRSDRPLPQTQDLRPPFFTQDGTVKAADGVSYEIGDGKTVGVVGESGCGKSITALSVMRLIEQPGRIVGGPVLLRGGEPLAGDGGPAKEDMTPGALSTTPDLLIANEPTTALDGTIQAQILELMKSLRERNRMAIMLITHDLGGIAEMADDVVVMYAGPVVEQAAADTVFP